MPRVKLYEHSAKKIILGRLGLPYDGVPVKAGANFAAAANKLPAGQTYSVKVDQGVKKRFKNGLIFLDVKPAGVAAALRKLAGRGYENFLIEKFIPHEQKEEQYFSLERTRAGIELRYSKQGGVDIEESGASIENAILKKENYQKITVFTHLEAPVLARLEKLFNDNHFSFLEINPLIVKNNQVHFLDLAATVDSAAEFFVNNISPVIPSEARADEESLSKRPRQRSLTIVRDDKNQHTTWNEKDMVKSALKTPEEKSVAVLKANTPAALSLTVINPNGSIFLLMSGGGASIVLADEVYNLGSASELANYGEYSGNPSEDETYAYTKEVISLMKKSNAKNKILIIGGGVANFTDIRATFRGIIRALDENKTALKKMKTKIFVRRGGPGQTEGLAEMKKFLNDNKFKGAVYGPELPLQKIVELALK